MTPTRSELAEIEKKVSLYLEVGRFEPAEKLLKTALADYGPMANLHNLLGLTYHKQSKFPEAIRQFKKALKANPAFVEGALNLVATLCDLSRYDEAQEVFTKLEQQTGSGRRQPELVLGRLANQHATAGRAYEQCGMSSEAVAEYRKALGLFARMPDVRLALAKLYARLGQNEKARQEFEELVKHHPDGADARNRLGVLYYKLGRKGEARAQWEEARKLDPHDLTSRAYLRLAHDWPLEGETAAASAKNL